MNKMRKTERVEFVINVSGRNFSPTMIAWGDDWGTPTESKLADVMVKFCQQWAKLGMTMPSTAIVRVGSKSVIWNAPMFMVIE